MLNDYIDVKAIFEALATLPDEIAAARSCVFVAEKALREAARCWVSVAPQAIEAADELARAETELANLETKFLAIRYTIKLAQTVGALQCADLAARLQQECEEMYDDEIPF
jgi:hypothetical protein